MTIPGTLQASMVHVLLPVFNRCRTTLQFVEYLTAQTYTDYHLVLIDDGSSDGTAAAVCEKLPGVTVLRGKGNWWWAGSLQKGHEWLIRQRIPHGDYVLVMNDDTEFDEDFLKTGTAILAQNPNTILTATGYNIKSRQPQDSAGYQFTWDNLSCVETYDIGEMNCLSTRGMLTTVGDFISVGGFHPRLIPHYLSDLEFTMRAHERGLKLMIHKDFRIYIDFEATGCRELGGESVVEYFKKILSRRAAMNPIAWSNFILLRCPWKHKVFNIARIWRSVYQQSVKDRLIPKIKSRMGIRF